MLKRMGQKYSFSPRITQLVTKLETYYLSKRLCWLHLCSCCNWLFSLPRLIELHLMLNLTNQPTIHMKTCNWVFCLVFVLSNPVRVFCLFSLLFLFRLIPRLSIIYHEIAKLCIRLCTHVNNIKHHFYILIGVRFVGGYRYSFLNGHLINYTIALVRWHPHKQTNKINNCVCVCVWSQRKSMDEWMNERTNGTFFQKKKIILNLIEIKWIWNFRWFIEHLFDHLKHKKN